MPIAIVAAAIIGGIMSQMQSASERQAAQTAMQNAVDDINATNTPPNLALPIILKHFQQAGILTPQLAQAIPQEFQSAVQIQENPEMREQQVTSLGQMQQLARTGYSPQDMAAMQQLRQQAQGDITSKQKQIIQQYAQMGQGSQGAQLAAMLSGAQQGGESEAQGAIQIGGQGAAARAAAIGQAGQQAGAIRSQDYNTLAANAANQQAWQANLLQNAEARNMYNTQTQNQANLYNTQTAQTVSDQNTAAANAELNRQAAAEQQQWADQLALNQAKANAQLGQAGFQGQQAQATAQGWQTMGTGAATGLAAVYGAQMKQPAAATPTTSTTYNYSNTNPNGPAPQLYDINGNPINSAPQE